MSELITIEDGIQLAKSDVISVFSDTDKLTPYLEQICDMVTVPESEIDLTTDKGRKAIGSRSHKVSRIKTALVKAGKDSITDLKAQVQKVNGGIKFVEENLNSLRDSTRAPLAEWEAEQERIKEEEAKKEQERIDAIKLKIDSIHDMATLHGGETIEQISSLIDAVSNIDCSNDFDEFAADALKAIAECKDSLSSQMQTLIQQKQQEELNAKLEAERKAGEIKERINKLRMIPVELMGSPSSIIAMKIDNLKSYEIPAEDFGDAYQEAVDSMTTVIEQLEVMKSQAEIVEAAKVAEKGPDEPSSVDEQPELEPQSPEVEEVTPTVVTIEHQETPDAWRDEVAPVVTAAEIIQSEPVVSTNHEQQAIAAHIQNFCRIDPATALLVAECLTTTDVPFISYTKKAA